GPQQASFAVQPPDDGSEAGGAVDHQPSGGGFVDSPQPAPPASVPTPRLSTAGAAGRRGHVADGNAINPNSSAVRCTRSTRGGHGNRADGRYPQCSCPLRSATPQ